MTPAARIAAAIEILDQWLQDRAALEQALTGWARRSRFAGSKDRAAIRDLVFDAARRRRSDAALGGAETGQGLMLGALRRSGVDPDTVFGAGGHAPEALSASMLAAGRSPQAGAEACDIPDWLWPHWQDSLGDQATATAHKWQSRAPVHLRVNLRAATREAAQAQLAQEGIITAPHPACDWALAVTEGERRLRHASAYLSGQVELQDAASQALVAALGDIAGARVLDFCAGGGGKTLALAAMGPASVSAHDIDPARMRDIPDRAARAGVQVDLLSPTTRRPTGDYDIVLCDAPCSGSGSWRRDPSGKWCLTAERLEELTQVQSQILQEAAHHLAPGGRLIYATCSVLRRENRDVAHGFAQRPPLWSRQWGAADETDGFYSAHLTA